MAPDIGPLTTEVLYQSLVESMPLCVFQKDRQFRLLFGNRRFCQALGRTLEELRGRTDFDLFPRELAEKYRRDDQRVLETGEPFEDIEQIAGADGHRSYIQVFKAPIRDATGRIVGLQGMFWEVTDRIVAQTRLEEAHAFLDSMVDNV